VAARRKGIQGKKFAGSLIEGGLTTGRNAQNGKSKGDEEANGGTSCGSKRRRDKLRREDTSGKKRRKVSDLKRKTRFYEDNEGGSRMPSAHAQTLGLRGGMEAEMY